MYRRNSQRTIGVRDGGLGNGRSPVLKNFRASACCSKILNDKKYIFNTVNLGQTLFSGQAQVAQKSWMIKNISIQWKISGQLIFQGKRRLIKNPEWWKIYIQFS